MFQVPFTQLFDLVRVRRVYLQGGLAYVPRDDMISILLTHYRSLLSQSLSVSVLFCNENIRIYNSLYMYICVTFSLKNTF